MREIPKVPGFKWPAICSQIRPMNWCGRTNTKMSAPFAASTTSGTATWDKSDNPSEPLAGTLTPCKTATCQIHWRHVANVLNFHWQRGRAASPSCEQLQLSSETAKILQVWGFYNLGFTCLLSQPPVENLWNMIDFLNLNSPGKPLCWFSFFRWFLKTLSNPHMVLLEWVVALGSTGTKQSGETKPLLAVFRFHRSPAKRYSGVDYTKRQGLLSHLGWDGLF